MKQETLCMSKQCTRSCADSYLTSFTFWRVILHYHKCKTLCAIWYHFIQSKKREKHPQRSVPVSKVATLLEVTLFHGYFSRFLNCANSTKARKASHMFSHCGV